MSAAITSLILTVAFETFGTACIQASQQFSRVWPSVGVLIGYGASFWFLSQALRALPLSVVYATWSGLGIVNITIIGYFVFGQKIGVPGFVRLLLVCSGIVVLHAFSGSTRT